ncbi:MAG: ABC transporter permease [Spirochaetales bacterium]
MPEAESSGKLRARGVLMYASLTYIVLLLLVSLFAPTLAPADPTDQDYQARLLPPGSEGHLLGTDDLGRDVLSRIMYGSRSALVVGLVSVSVALVLGLAIGLTAGMAGGRVESTLMLFMDALLSFPTILLAIAVVTVFGYGITQVMVAIGIVFSPVFARLVRAEALSLKNEGYVLSARALGRSTVGVTLSHILPNMLGKLIVQCSVTFALAVVIEAGLSYLGLGTQPPNPSWGLMLKDARNFLFTGSWLAFYPGLAIALTVLSFNLLGDTLAERLNPLTRQ